MNVHVDRDKCVGHGRCYALAPQVFQPDDIGNAEEVGDGTVPPELEAKARLAAANCPEMAVIITDDVATDVAGAGTS